MKLLCLGMWLVVDVQSSKDSITTGVKFAPTNVFLDSA